MAPTAKQQSAPPSGLTWLAILATIGVIAFLLAWLLGWIRFTTDPRLLEIRALREDAERQFVATGGPATLADATAAVAAMGQIREKVRALPKHLRPAAEEEVGNTFGTTFRSRINAYFAVPPEKRQAELDRQIKQEDLMRRAFEAAGTRAGASGGPREGSTAGAADNAPAPAAAPGPRSRTEEERNIWRKQMIDRTSPEQRARYVEYRNAMEKRRDQLGLPPRGPR